MNTPYAFKKCTKCGEWLVANTHNFCRCKAKKYSLQSICKQCKRKIDKEYRENNKESIKIHKKEHYQKNKEKISAKKKEYYNNNKDYILAHNRKYQKENKEKISEKNKEYRIKNREEILTYKKQWYEENKDYKLERDKQYREENKEYIAEYKRIYYRTPKGIALAFNSSSKRRFHKEQQGNGINAEQWLHMMNWFSWKCAYSNKYIGGTVNRNRSIDHITPLDKGGEHEIWNVVPMYLPYNSSKWNNEMEDWYRRQEFYSEERLQKILEWQEYAKSKWGKATQ